MVRHLCRDLHLAGQEARQDAVLFVLAIAALVLVLALVRSSWESRPWSLCALARFRPQGW